MNLTRVFVIATLAIAISSLFAGCTKRAELSTNREVYTAHLRVINACSVASEIDVTYDKETPITHLVFMGSSGYQSVFSGKHNIGAYSSDEAKTKLARINEDLKPGEYYSGILVGTKGSTKLILLNDDLSPGPAGQARVRFVNAIPDPDVRWVQLRNVTGDKILFKNMKYEGVSPYKNIKAGKYDMELNLDDLATSLTRLSDQELKPGKVYTMVAQGRLYEGSIAVQVYEDN